MENKPAYKIPTWDPDNQWTYTTFQTKEEFREFVKGLFKIPGEYGFDETAWEFNKQARVFKKTGMFCDAPEGSTDFLNYWDAEKEKCRKGVIYKNNKGGVWYLPRFYYHWVNLLQIYDKVKKDIMFPDVMDVQYHMALYETLAELYGKHSAKVKRRQIAGSYFHIAIIYNKYVFEKGYSAKIMASDKTFIDATKGCWKFLEEYHNFTNTHTAWIRQNNPSKEFSWQQKVENRTEDGRVIDLGLKGTIVGITLKESPTKGVGGPADDVYYEEGGIAPTANITYEYMKPAMKFGEVTTGKFCISGSVGELSDCMPLKEMVMNPLGNDIYPVETNLIDNDGTTGISGLFIPAQWGRVPYMDKYGNSMVQEALDSLTREFEEAKLVKNPEDYQRMLSQNPRSLKEAFDVRTVSKFPTRYTGPQQKRIEGNEYAIEYVDLSRNDKDEIVAKPSDRRPIMDFPVKKAAPDKRGVVCISEKPIRDKNGRVEWGTYYGSLDPVNKGKSNSSDSLASIYIYKNPIEVTRTDAEGNTETYLEGDKIVAWWCGRYDDINETNELISMLVEYYNAWTISEAGPWIQYMIGKRRTKYLVPRKEMLFDQELENNQKVFDTYGWTNSTKLWELMLEYAIDFLSEILKTEYNDDGTVAKITYGVERIPDIMLIKEMQVYDPNPRNNYDRIISYGALVTFAKIQQNNSGIRKRMEKNDDSLEKTQKLSTLSMRQAFTHIGRGQRSVGGSSVKRSAFRNIK